MSRPLSPARLKTLLLPLLTFAVGLGTGALVFSGQPEPPPPAPVPTPVAAPAPAPEQPAPVAVMSAALAPASPADAPDPADLKVLEQVATLMDGWGRMQADLAGLRARVAVLEQRPTTVASVSAPAAAAPTGPDQQRQALVRAGVPAVQAEEIINRGAQVALQQLELRDLAIREGWLGSDRYRDELTTINAAQVSLRDELDNGAYDRYLYESGESNRVQVESVIPGSVGAETGLLPGDLIERYGEQPIFDYRELRQATSSGERGELVPVQVRRGPDTLEVWLPRGPIGVQLDGARVRP